MRLRLAAITGLVLALAPAARAARPLALNRLDPLGLDPEITSRLEALLRAELERIVKNPVPSGRETARVVAERRDLQGCTGAPECLAGIGRALGADKVVDGNVGGLGESYVINLKIVDAHAGREIRRVSQVLHGDPDVLIEEIRVAAYRLIAPEQVRGALAILSDARAAHIFLDGTPIGVTPTVGPIGNLPVGDHALRIALDGYADFLRTVTIRFQKTTQVVVHMEALPGARPILADPGPEPVHFYGRGWFYAVVGVAAVGAGIALGYWATTPHELDCRSGACR
jgi:hypothetical protein